MKPTQADMLLRIAENTFADGDVVMTEWAALRHKLAEHANRVLEDEELLIKAWEINQRDKTRFAQYMPVEAAAKTEGRAALGSTQQRMAIGVIKDEKAQVDERRQSERQGRERTMNP